MSVGTPKLGWHGVRKYKNGKFQARWVDADGERTEMFNTSTQASAHATRMANEALNVKVGISVARKPILEAKAAFLDRPTKANTRELNNRRVSEFLAAMPGIRDTSLLTDHSINQYARMMEESGHSQGDMNHHLKIVRCFTNFCIKSKWLMENPFADFRMPKTQKAGRPLTDEEYNLMVTPGKTHNQYTEGERWLNLAFRFGHSTMLRIGQVWKLTPAEFKAPNLIFVDIFKGQPAVWVPLQDEAAAILRDLLPTTGAGENFFKYWGTVDAMRNSVQDKARRVGLEGVRFHDVCKVTRVTNLSEGGYSLGDLAHLSNTSKKTLADNYIMPDRDRAFAKYLNQPVPNGHPILGVLSGVNDALVAVDASPVTSENVSTSQQIPSVRR